MQVRFLARGFTVSGDHGGQTSTGVRWPYGAVGLITPFNFPLEIPVLQLMGALYMGNKPLVHVDRRVSIVMEQFIRLLIDCGMPATDLDLLHGPGTTMGHIIEHADPRSVLFTGAPPCCSMRCATLLPPAVLFSSAPPCFTTCTDLVADASPCCCGPSLCSLLVHS